MIESDQRQISEVFRGVQVPSLQEGGVGAAASGVTRVFDQGAWGDCALMTRGALRDGAALAGPALIEDETSTIFMPPGWRAEVDPRDNIVIRMED